MCWYDSEGFCHDESECGIDKDGYSHGSCADDE